MRHVLRAACFWALVLMAPVMADTPRRMLEFGDLHGWARDDHLAALRTFSATCGLIRDPDWTGLCALALDQPKTAAAARTFFEMFFRPVQIGTPPALFTGYYEPELTGSLRRDARFAWPIYRRPPEFTPGQLWHSRAEIERSGVLRGRGLELAWLDDPVEVFFLQIQGSGRIRLADGRTLRVGFDGKNGHPYRSVGTELVRRGLFQAHQVSAQTIKRWVQAHPAEGRALLQVNPSFVFFRALDEVPDDRGPLGAMGRSVTAGRTIAVDPDFTLLGAPVWLEKQGDAPIHRLMVAQDTGSAIKGAQRADIFFGTGAEAGEVAGRVRDGGRMLVLLPIARAMADAATGGG